MIKVKNISDSETVCVDVILGPGEEYEIPDSQKHLWSSDSELLSQIVNNIVQIGTATEYYSDINKQIDILKQSIIKLEELPESKPFAEPIYRTENDAISNMVSVNVNQGKDIDFKVDEDRYISGGSIYVENNEFGDYIRGSIVDIDGTIPPEYRGNYPDYPTVVTYVKKKYIKKSGELDVDTRPLTAKIPGGLYLRIKYTAANKGVVRNVVINYNLTKKL